jgi:hypothetical protein
MLRKFWEAWKRIAQKIGNFQARVLLTIIYASLVLPFGLLTRLFADPLRVRRRPEGWIDHPDVIYDAASARRQW